MEQPAPEPEPEPEPTVPTVAFVGIEDGATITRGDQVVIAAASTDATTVTYTLDGDAIEAGAVPARDLALGEHTITVTAEGAGGTVTETVTFQVIVTVDSVKERVVSANLSLGSETLILLALDRGEWKWASSLVTWTVPKSERAVLLEEINFLAKN